MSIQRLIVLAAAALAVSFLEGPVQSAGAQPGRWENADRVLTGELVVTDASRNRFRLVGHERTFEAPPGAPMETLDGKPVNVAVSQGGRVLQISEAPVDVERVANAYEVVSGKLVASETSERAFSIVGDERVFVAPAGVDVDRYAGRTADVFLDDQGEVIHLEVGAAPARQQGDASCTYAGKTYSHGSVLCQAGAQQRCEAGVWRSLGTECGSPGDGCTANGVDYASGATRCQAGDELVCENGQWRHTGTDCEVDYSQSCEIGDATVAAGSSICRDGRTFRCVAGKWVDVGKACS